MGFFNQVQPQKPGGFYWALPTHENPAFKAFTQLLSRLNRNYLDDIYWYIVAFMVSVAL